MQKVLLTIAGLAITALLGAMVRAMLGWDTTSRAHCGFIIGTIVVLGLSLIGTGFLEISAERARLRKKLLNATEQ